MSFTLLCRNPVHTLAPAFRGSARHAILETVFEHAMRMSVFGSTEICGVRLFYPPRTQLGTFLILTCLGFAQLGPPNCKTIAQLFAFFWLSFCQSETSKLENEVEYSTAGDKYV